MVDENCVHTSEMKEKRDILGNLQREIGVERLLQTFATLRLGSAAFDAVICVIYRDQAGKISA